MFARAFLLLRVIVFLTDEINTNFGNDQEVRFFLNTQKGWKVLPSFLISRFLVGEKMVEKKDHYLNIKIILERFKDS